MDEQLLSLASSTYNLICYTASNAKFRGVETQATCHQYLIPEYVINTIIKDMIWLKIFEFFKEQKIQITNKWKN